MVPGAISCGLWSGGLLKWDMQLFFFLETSFMCAQCTCTHYYTHTYIHTLCTHRGAFSEVYRVQDKESSKEFAIKIIDKKSLRGKEDALKTEISVLQK